VGFLTDLIKLTALETAHDIIKSKTDASKLKHDEKDLENLEKLKKLYDSGAITEKEYNKKKKEILKRK